MLGGPRAVVMGAAVQGGGAAPDPAFVQAGTEYDGSSTTSFTFAYTCAVDPGANRILGLAYASRGSFDPTPFDTATYNGAALTNIVFVRNTAGAPDTFAGCLFLLGASVPNDGAAHNFVIDWPGASSAALKAVPFELINVKQETPTVTGTDTPSLTTDPSIDLLLVEVGALLVDCCMSNAGTGETPTYGANQTEIGALNISGLSFAASIKLPADHAGGTVNMTQDWANSAAKAYVAVAFRKA